MVYHTHQIDPFLMRLCSWTGLMPGRHDCHRLWRITRLCRSTVAIDFFLWMVVMSVVMFPIIARDERRL